MNCKGNCNMENIKEVFKEIIGKAIYQIIKAAHSLNIQFGEAINCDDGIVGQYIFHIECPWRIKKGSVLLGWGDGMSLRMIEMVTLYLMKR